MDFHPQFCHSLAMSVSRSLFTSPSLSFLFSKIACVLVAQSCPTLCNPIDCSPPGTPVHGILQARTLGWLPFPSPKGNIERKKVKSLSCV